MDTHQQVLNPTPPNPTPATWHKRKRKLHCNFQTIALQKLHCDIRFLQCGRHFYPNWRRGSTGVQRYGCIPCSAANNLGEIPKKFGSSKSLVLKSFWVERTFWDSSLLVSLALWDTPALFAPPLPLPQPKLRCNKRKTAVQH